MANARLDVTQGVALGLPQGRACMAREEEEEMGRCFYHLMLITLQVCLKNKPVCLS